MYVCCCAIGWSSLSTKDDNFSVGPSHPNIIYRPTNWSWFVYFCKGVEPSVPNLKQILMKEWHLSKSQPLLNDIFKERPITSYKKGSLLKDTLVRAKL